MPATLNAAPIYVSDFQGSSCLLPSPPPVSTVDGRTTTSVAQPSSHSLAREMLQWRRDGGQSYGWPSQEMGPESMTGHGSHHFCACVAFLFPQHRTRHTIPPYSSFLLFLLSSGLPLHYLASLKLSLSSWPNLTKQHSTSQRRLYDKRGRVMGVPWLQFCGELARGQEWEWKELRDWSQKTCIQVSHWWWLCHPGKSPMPTSLSLVPLFINWG